MFYRFCKNRFGQVVIFLLFFIILLKLNNKTKDIDNISKLLNSLNINEKCGQMTQVAFAVISKDPYPNDPSENPVNITRLKQVLVNHNIGSILNPPQNVTTRVKTWHQVLQTIQQMATQETSTKIPILYGIDSIHGANYVAEAVLFPQPINMAATFNTKLVSQIGHVTAKETRAAGIRWNFSPILDVGRQTAWSRLWETFGEDVFLVRQMGKAYINGHQGNGDFTNRNNTATCLKHYIGYSNPLNGRDRTVAWIPENLLREVFLPPFEEAIKAGAMTVMINSADVNGIPGHANYHYLTEILKKELKFEGFTVSDWEDIIRLHTRDKIAETPEEAVRIAVMAGVDMSMVPFDLSFHEHCISLAHKDTAFLARVNEATERILRVKHKLALFDNPFPTPSDSQLIGLPQHEQLNLQAARQSIVLAKNNKGLLPLTTDTRVFLTGPTSNALRVLNGGWSYCWHGDCEQLFRTFAKDKLTLAEAIKNKVENFDFSQGATFKEIIALNETLAKASQADVIILSIGEDTYCEATGVIDDLSLGEVQTQLADALFTLGKPVVLVYLGGRPRIMTSLAERAHAVLVAFLPGNRGAEAIADVIFGDVNPSGRMPVTYPRAPHGITLYDARPIEFAEPNGYQPLYAFGWGLSYTTFEYSALKLNVSEAYAPSGVSVTVSVRNVGDWQGHEVVMLFLNDEYSSVSRAHKQLKAFEKVWLEPGETAKVTLHISLYDMSFIGKSNKRIYETGEFNVFVGDKQASFALKSSGMWDDTNESETLQLNYCIWSIILFTIAFFIILSNRHPINKVVKTKIDDE